MDIAEFEFDISNVAAFESVATEDPNQDSQQFQQLQQNDQQLLHHHLQQQQLDQTDLQQPLITQQQEQHHSPRPNTPDQQQHQNVAQQPQQQQTRILLVPINPGKQLYQLATLTTSGNKKQIIQLAPLQGNQVSTSSSSKLSQQVNHNSKQLQLHQLPLHQQQQQQQHHLPQQLNQNNQNLLQQQPSLNNKSSTSILPEVANEVPKRKPCNCTKSQCLKLYCDCFANGEFCSGCNCTNCFNSLEKEKERQKAISQCLERNPEAFRPKIGKAVKASIGEPAPESIERRHTKGCNCKRSGCLKNYCECYEAKILCSNLCKCCGCKNYEESFERKTLMQLANSQSENARGILKSLLPTNTSSNTGREFTKCFITDKVINASLVCLLQSAQQAEKDGLPENSIPNLIQTEMGKCLRMIVDSAMTLSSNGKS